MALAKEDKGMFFIPNLPVSYVLDRELYFKIADICSGILYPYKTLMLQSNAIFIPYKKEDPNLARGFFFPWVDGIPTRLTITDINQFIKKDVSESCIPLMANQVNIDLNDVVHLAISGSSGSGKSYFLEYLIRCIRKITDDIIAVDPKRADIYSLCHELNLSVLSPKRGANLNSFITEVNEVLGDAINKIYERQEFLLNNPNAPLKRTYIIIDELLALVQGSSKQARDTFAQLLGTVALLGRATKVSLILVSQVILRLGNKSTVLLSWGKSTLIQLNSYFLMPTSKILLSLVVLELGLLNLVMENTIAISCHCSLLITRVGKHDK